jgi:hypothetical protein
MTADFESRSRFACLLPIGGIVVSLLVVLLIAYGSYREGFRTGFRTGRDAERYNLMLREAVAAERETALGLTTQP